MCSRLHLHIYSSSGLVNGKCCKGVTLLLTILHLRPCGLGKAEHEDMIPYESNFPSVRTCFFLVCRMMYQNTMECRPHCLGIGKLRGLCRPASPRSNTVARYAHLLRREADNITPMKTIVTVLLTASAVLAPPPPSQASLDITYADKSVKQKLQDRDDAMEFKCKGGMFDCDGDRRDYAHKQYQEFVEKQTGKGESDEQHQEPTEPSVNTEQG